MAIKADVIRAEPFKDATEAGSFKKGDSVQMSQELGRSGTTGLAGGDHLHFTMLLGGRAVTPIDWWSAQWVEDRITRKLREAGAG